MLERQQSAELSLERWTQGTINDGVQNTGGLEQERYHYSQCMRGLANDDPYDQNDSKRGKPAEHKCEDQNEQNFGQVNFLDTDTIQGKMHARVVFTDLFGDVIVREANQ